MIVIAIVPASVASVVALTNADPELAAFAASAIVTAQPYGSGITGSLSVGRDATAPETVLPIDKTADYAY